MEQKYLLQKYTFYFSFHVTTNKIYIQLPEKHLGAGDYGRDVHFGESDLRCLTDFEFDQYFLELINIIQNCKNMINMYCNP